MALRVHEHVLGLDVSVANSESMNVGNRPHQLVSIELDDQVRNHLLHFDVVLHDFVNRFGDEVHHHIQILLIRLVSVCVKILFHLNTEGVVEHFEDLELSVFVALVLEDLFDGHGLSGLCDHCFENHTERSVAYDLFCVIS